MTLTLPTIAALVACALAGYRLAVLVSEDDISEPLRRWLYRRAFPSGDPTMGRRWLWSWVYTLAACPLCTGWWATLLVFVAWFAGPEWIRWPIACLAAIGLQAYLSQRD